MPDLRADVRRLSAAAWALRQAAPPCRKPLPPFACALFTDDRRQGNLLALLESLPAVPTIPPLAIVFRHDGVPVADRRALASVAGEVVQARGHLLLVARMTGFPGAQGLHGGRGLPRRGGIVSRPVHAIDEALAARRDRADIVFVSPVFATRSHPGAPGLGPARAGAIAAATDVPAFALGGMTVKTTRRLAGLPLYGIGAIGAFGAD